LSEMTQIALDCGGTIDKFIGDAILIFFGDPETQGEREDALACIDMATRMQTRIKEMQGYWKKNGVSDG
ncbi:MAG TPA: adenylate/guanylate cyclase domain-containing protein, partial [Gammaproteobacteria bacterium]|nr:adenylate/guanylate cyclase domain-containing protein [Gammaproteobacteria bacterium]